MKLISVIFLMITLNSVSIQAEEDNPVVAWLTFDFAKLMPSFLSKTYSADEAVVAAEIHEDDFQIHYPTSTANLFELDETHTVTTNAPMMRTTDTPVMRTVPQDEKPTNKKPNRYEDELVMPDTTSESDLYIPDFSAVASTTSTSESDPYTLDFGVATPTTLEVFEDGNTTEPMPTNSSSLHTELLCYSEGCNGKCDLGYDDGTSAYLCTCSDGSKINETGYCNEGVDEAIDLSTQKLKATEKGAGSSLMGLVNRLAMSSGSQI